MRTVVLGDSFAWGWGVKDNQMLTAQLARRLGAARLTDRALEFDNLAVPGYDTAAEVGVLEHVGLPLQPDVAVLWFFLNDVGNTVTVVSLGENDRFTRVRRLSRLLDVVLAPIDGMLGQSELVANYRSSYVDGQPGWEAAKHAIARFGALCHEHRIVPIVAVHPVLMRLDDYPFTDIHHKVLDVAHQNGIAGIDLLPAFAGRRAEDLWVHPADQHPNEIGHQLAAELVAPQLGQILKAAAEHRH